VESGEGEQARWLRYNELDKRCKQENWPEYRALPAQTAQQILKLLDRNWKSFFSAIAVWSTKKEAFTGRPKLPGYLRNDRNIIIFTNQQAKIKNDGHIHSVSLSITPINTISGTSSFLLTS
jgi:putative transposase